MIAKVFISENLEVRKNKLSEEFESLGLKLNHPDLLYISNKDKLGVEKTKVIKDFLNLKPYSANKKGVVLETGDDLTIQAQNSLLKILEELPENVFFLMGASSDESLLPTIKSRCELIFLETSDKSQESNGEFLSEIEKLEQMSLEQRFILIEKIEEKAKFLEELIYFYRQKLLKDSSYLKFSTKLLQAQSFHKHNVNIRSILEYLMLNLD